eukprot:TRINITY_DN15084_c0_g2_i1.p1 TRINITY_DN15084_c0_g2~~TRINITY_DN15084_c0_g2_i1.p1  ORF type:complete len:319 (-),score=45.25 TRINITY_DN15084_c0_g2_i1:192-1148(-)
MPKDEEPKPALFLAVDQDDAEAIGNLVAAKADVNQKRRPFGWTPLHEALDALITPAVQGAGNTPLVNSGCISYEAMMSTKATLGELGADSKCESRCTARATTASTCASSSSLTSTTLLSRAESTRFCSLSLVGTGELRRRRYVVPTTGGSQLPVPRSPSSPDTCAKLTAAADKGDCTDDASFQGPSAVHDHDVVIEGPLQKASPAGRWAWYHFVLTEEELLVYESEEAFKHASREPLERLSVSKFDVFRDIDSPGVSLCTDIDTDETLLRMRAGCGGAPQAEFVTNSLWLWAFAKVTQPYCLQRCLQLRAARLARSSA